MCQITGQTLGTEKVQHRTVKDISFSLRLVNSAGTGAVTVMPNLRNITCKLELRRAGITHKNFEDNLQNLAVESLYHKGLEPVISSSYLQQKGNGQAIMPIRLHLPDVIECRGTDVLTLTVNVLPGTYATGFNTANCVLDVEFVDAHGIEHAIPMIGTRYIQAGTNTWPESLGNHVKEITVINYDQGLGGSSTLTDAQVVFQGVTVQSEGLNINETADRLYNRIYRTFEMPTAAYFRGQCFKICPGHGHAHMNRVQLQLQLNAALNTAGNNVILYRYFEYNAETHVRSVQSQHEQHTAHAHRIAGVIGHDAIQQGLAIQAQPLHLKRGVHVNGKPMMGGHR